MEALSTSQEKIPAIWWAVMVLCGSSAADKEFGPASKGNSNEKRRRTLYERWPLAANAVNKTNNYQISYRYDTSEKDRNIYNIFGTPVPIPDFRASRSFTDFLLPLDGTVRWRLALC
jgi:hypothetical protein